VHGVGQGDGGFVMVGAQVSVQRTDANLEHRALENLPIDGGYPPPPGLVE
jgi:hypothetical protein